MRRLSVERFHGAENWFDAVARGFRAAIDEAARFIGATAPNPPVGCAILDADGNILAQAAHQRAGSPHAEALALRLCRDAGRLDRAATAIVTLEPCNHVGRTGPCTEAILASPIRSVWIGAADPNPHVAGGGEALLREAGLSVGRLESDAALALDCAALIAPFTRFSRTERPWVTVKQALDADGGMIPVAGAKTFTGPGALRLAHRLRRATDAIITGTGTILADQPHLTVRHVPDHPGRRRVLGVAGHAEHLPSAWRRAAEANGFILRIATDLPALLRLLGEEGVLWAMVEAGPRLLASLEREALWDDWLTIRHDADGPNGLGDDHYSVRTRSGISPLRLIEGLSAARGQCAKEAAACSPAS